MRFRNVTDRIVNGSKSRGVVIGNSIGYWLLILANNKRKRLAVAAASRWSNLGAGRARKQSFSIDYSQSRLLYAQFPQWAEFQYRFKFDGNESSVCPCFTLGLVGK